MPNLVPAAAEGLPDINRRCLLSGLAAVAAASTTVGATAATYEAPAIMNPREQAIWHMRELERLALEDGAGSAVVILVGRPWGRPNSYNGHCKTLMLDINGAVDDCGDADFLAPKGGAA